MVGRTVVTTKQGKTAIKLHNPFNHPVSLRKCHTVGYFHFVDAVLGEIRDATADVASVSTQSNPHEAEQAKRTFQSLGIELQDSNLRN